MPRPIHFEIQAENIDRAIKFYTTLFGWKFSQWGQEQYWLITTGEKGTPGIDGGLLPRRGPGTGGNGRGQRVRLHGATSPTSTRRLRAGRGARRHASSLPRMPIPTVGWLAYGKDTEGNIFGMMQMDAAAK